MSKNIENIVSEEFWASKSQEMNDRLFHRSEQYLTEIFFRDTSCPFDAKP